MIQLNGGVRRMAVHSQVDRYMIVIINEVGMTNMKINIDLTDKDFQLAVADYIQRHTGVEPSEYTMIIEVKSKQNYKSEWEQAELRVKFMMSK